MKKLLTFLLALMMVLSMFSFASAEEPITIKIAHWDVESSLVENDAMREYVENKFGIRLEAMNTTWDDYVQKIQAWAAADSLPDIFSIDAICTPNYYAWIEDEVVHALPADLSAYPNLEAYLDVADIQALKIDGQLYCIPRKTYPSDYWMVCDRTIAYRWDLAQEAGITKEPETFDEFREMIQAIIKADPEGKQIQGLTSLQAKQLDGFLFTYSMPAAMSDGSGSDYKWVKGEDGIYRPRYFTTDMLSTFQLARDMYVEGTIEKDYALTTSSTATEKFLTGQSAAILGGGGVAAWYGRLGKNWAEANDGADFTEDVRILKILEGKDGQKTFPMFRTAWSESYISSHVDDAKLEKILQLYDFLVSSEGQMLINWGFDGVDYEMKDGKAVSLLDGVSLSSKYPCAGFLNNLASWGQSNTNRDYPTDAPTEWYRDNDFSLHEQAEATGEMPSFDMRITYMSTPLKDSFVINQADDLIKVMMGTEPVEDMVNELIKEYEDKGLQAMIDEVNAKAAELGY